MANIRVAKALDRIGAEMARVRSHVIHSSGVSAKEAAMVERDCLQICEMAASIAAEARHAQGVHEREGAFVKRVRKALGYSYP